MSNTQELCDEDGFDEDDEINDTQELSDEVLLEMPETLEKTNI